MLRYAAARNGEKHVIVSDAQSSFMKARLSAPLRPNRPVGVTPRLWTWRRRWAIRSTSIHLECGPRGSNLHPREHLRILPSARASTHPLVSFRSSATQSDSVLTKRRTFQKPFVLFAAKTARKVRIYSALLDFFHLVVGNRQKRYPSQQPGHVTAVVPIIRVHSHVAIVQQKPGFRERGGHEQSPLKGFLACRPPDQNGSEARMDRLRRSGG